MPDFSAKLQQHVEHVKNVGPHCLSEETTKQALVLPFLNIIDFNPFDPTKVQAEYGANFPGAKNNERVDYALFSDGHPVMYIEAKPYSEKLTNHSGQLSRYFNSTPGVGIAALTNGREWRFFTDLKNQNIMDDSPFLKVDFMDFSDSDAHQLSRFRYDCFHPDKLKTFAEERVYLSIFQNVIETCLRDPDIDFVKYVATRANLAPKLTTRFVDAIAPLVKQSVTDAISRVVVSGLSAPPVNLPEVRVEEYVSPKSDADQVDSENPKIVTTAAERKILSIVQTMLDGQVAETDIVGKDTESYYAVLYQNKTNRWIVRYQGDRAKPIVSFCVNLSDQYKELVCKRGLELGPGNSIVLPRPENIMKLSEIVFDSVAYCQDDNNFKRDSKKESETQNLEQ